MPGKSNHTQVVYKPLAVMNPNGGTNLEIDGDEDELEVITGPNEENGNDKHRNAPSRTNLNWRYFQRQHGRSIIGLRQFRTILFAIATILLIIFILKLATYKDHANSESPESPTPPKVESFTEAQDARAAESLHKHIQHKTDQETRADQVSASSQESEPESSASNVQVSSSEDKPKYNDNYLSSIIHNQNSDSPANLATGLDDFKFSIGDERLPESTRNDGNKWWKIAARSDKHVSISNYVRAMKSFSYNCSVTLSTMLVLSSQQFHHSLELCERWDGPISIAVFLSRGLNELPLAVSLIKFVRLCLPAPLSACMRDKITWHLVYSSARAVDVESLNSSLTYPKYHLDTINYSSFTDTDQCPKYISSSTNELIDRFQADILSKNNKSLISMASAMMKDANSREDGTPVNVLRNIAREAAQTKYVLVTNADLYPSLHLADQFLELVQSRSPELDSKQNIFALPAFEVQQDDSGPKQIPKTKSRLADLTSSGKVRPYSEALCPKCQEFPKRREWLLSAGNQSDKLAVFEQAKWTRSGSRAWSPFFLAQNSYPAYNEHLAVNERVDLMYEMCLLNYSLLVLDNGFLVRLTDLSESSSRANAKTGDQDTSSVEEALASLVAKYKDNVNIKKC